MTPSFLLWILWSRTCIWLAISKTSISVSMEHSTNLCPLLPRKSAPFLVVLVASGIGSLLFRFLTTSSLSTMKSGYCFASRLLTSLCARSGNLAHVTVLHLLRRPIPREFCRLGDIAVIPHRLDRCWNHKLSPTLLICFDDRLEPFRTASL
jgi:hypothetical protein